MSDDAFAVILKHLLDTHLIVDEKGEIIGKEQAVNYIISEVNYYKKEVLKIYYGKKWVMNLN